MACRSAVPGGAEGPGSSWQGVSAWRSPPPPPPPLACTAAPPVWPLLAFPRLVVEEDREMAHADLCVVRRTRAMAELEGRLQHAMVVYVGGDMSGLSPDLVRHALQARRGIPADRFQCIGSSRRIFLWCLLAGRTGTE